MGLIVVQEGVTGGVSLDAGGQFTLVSTGLTAEGYWPVCGEDNLSLSFRPAELNSADYGKRALFPPMSTL